MTDTPMFVAAARRKEKAAWPIALAFAGAGLAFGFYFAFPIALEPAISDAGAALSAQVGPALLGGIIILPLFLIACMVLKRGISGPAIALVAAAAILTPFAAPFAGEAIGGVIYGKERAVLAALEEETSRRVAQEDAKLAAADLGQILTTEGFSGKDFDAYRARVKGYRDAALALKAINDGKVAALEARLADSGVSAERREAMLASARARADAAAPRAGEIHDLRMRVADNADAGLALVSRPNSWSLWYGQINFTDPAMGADLGRRSVAVRESLAMLRRLEGKRAVIGVSAQKRAT